MIERSKRLALQRLAGSVISEKGMMNLPVSPRALAKAFDIEVHPFDFGNRDISGCLMGVGNSFAIAYSTSIKNPGFQNFTIAHELGHYLIPGHHEALDFATTPHYSKSGFISADRHEEEADAFAAELLMPWKLIEPDVRARRAGFESIKAISENCESSLVASAIRFCQYTNACVAAVVSFEGSVEFMTASDTFKTIPGLEWLKRGDPVPSSVPSKGRCIDYEWIARCEIDEEGSLLQSWFPNALQMEVEEDVVGLGSYGRLLTVLLVEWNPEEEEDEKSSSDDWIARWNKGLFRPKR